MADVQPAATSAAQSAASPRSYPKSRTIFQRLIFGIRIWIFKFLTTTFFRVLSLPGIRKKSILPTFTKIYPCRPSLTNRIFIPKSYKSDGALLPLYLDIHGGGFAIGSPIMDDKFCSSLANKNKVLVVCLDYPKSPHHPYPAAVEALQDLVRTILQDDTLPIDKKKVAIGGFSAGANLALAVSQDKGLQKKIGGLVAIYPPVDFTVSIADKLATRPKDAGPDPLESMAPIFDWAYINPDQNLKDPQLSVTYAPREALPQKLYIIGCELDLLCKGAQDMAQKLANIGNGERVGTDDVWEKNGVKWEKVLGEEHGFDMTPASGAKKIRVEKRTQEMYDAIAEWLFREVYV